MSKKKKSKKLKKAAKSRLAKSEKKLLSASDALLTISVETGKKWHKLFKHSITTSEPILEKQIDMFFDTTDAVRDQLEERADRFKKMLGVKEDIGEIVQKKISQNKVAKQIANSANKLIAIVDESGIKDRLEKGAVKIKMEITDRISGKDKKKDKKKSSKKKVSKKKNTSKKSKSTASKKKATAIVKTKTTVAKRRGRPVGSKKKTAAAKKAISSATKTTTKKTTAKRRGRPAGSTSKSVTAKKATTGAKRGPKPGAKRKTTGTATKTTRGVKKKTTTPAKKTTRSVKVKTTAKRATTPGKRGRKPKAGRPGYDDLKKVMGIGAKMEKILNEKGIKTYSNLKAMKVGDLQSIIDSAGGYYQSYKPQMWKSEAALAADGKFDQMKSGRR